MAGLFGLSLGGTIIPTDQQVRGEVAVGGLGEPPLPLTRVGALAVTPEGLIGGASRAETEERTMGAADSFDS
jgi:hypothetical protein